MNKLRLDIGDDADDALAAQGQQGDHLVIVAGVDVQLVAAEGRDLRHLTDIAGGFLDAVDERVLAQLLGRLGGDVQAGAGRHIIQDDRNAAGLCHCGKVGDKASLRGLVVVGSHQQQSVCAAGGRLCSQSTAVVGVVGTGTGDDRHTVTHEVHGILDGSQLLLVGHGRALAGGATDDDGVGAAGDLILNDAAQLIEIDAAVLIHRGDDGNTRTSKNRILHSKKLLCSALKFKKRADQSK